MAKKFLHDVNIVSTASWVSGLTVSNLPSAALLGTNANGLVVAVDPSTIGAVAIGPSEPVTPVAWQLWLDTSVSPNQLMAYTGTDWIPTTDKVQHYDDVASFPATWDTGVVYIADDSSIGYVWNGTSYVNMSGTGNGLFTISDGTTSENVEVGNTVTFAGANLITPTVSATDTVTYTINTAGAVAGQAVVFDGTNVVFANATATRFTETITPVVNTQFVVTHNLNQSNPIVQVRDAITNEVVWVEIAVLSANTVGITSTTTDNLIVVVL